MFYTKIIVRNPLYTGLTFMDNKITKWISLCVLVLVMIFAQIRELRIAEKKELERQEFVRENLMGQVGSEAGYSENQLESEADTASVGMEVFQATE